MATAYAMMVNGGKHVTPYFIERIQDRHGRTILRHDSRTCVGCNPAHYNYQPVPELEDPREQVIDPLSAYQMVSILEGVAQRGTGTRLRSLGRHVGGKTGTTNDNRDAWFVGFSPDLVVGVYVGFDEPRTLGRRETAAAVALPVFHEFMREALVNQADTPFRIPDGIKLVRVNHDTGRPAVPGDSVVITEALKPNFILGANQRVIGSDSREIDASEIEGSRSFFEDVMEDSDIQLGTQY
jgi:penicillin-binding protein 1A